MLINAGHYVKGARKELTPSEVLELTLDLNNNGDNFSWLAFKDPTDSELQQLKTIYKIPDLVIEDILHGNQHSKMEEYANGLIFVSMKQYEWNGAELIEGEASLVAAPHFAISSRRGIGGDFSKVRQRAQEETELLAKGPGFVLYAIMDIVVDRYFPVVVEFEKRVDALEEKMFSAQAPTVEQRKQLAHDLHSIRRELGKFKQGVEPLLEATIKLFGGRVPKLCDHLGEYFRDVHDHLTRIVSACERLRDDATAATQTNLALVAIDESETTKKLASYAAIFAVVTLMAGIWGMNFENMPELKWKYGYLCAICSMLIVSVGLWIKFKKARWL